MGYTSLSECIKDLERSGQLVRVKEEIDPHLEMASVHMHVNRKSGPAILFENVIGCKFPAVSNLFGTMERARFIFRNELRKVEKVLRLRNDPRGILRDLSSAWYGLNSIPKKSRDHSLLANEIRLSELPQIQCWPKDGGAFITLPLVYSENAFNPGVKNSNLGMYRVQMSGNEYVMDKEAGMHYQIHRGIGVHQAAAMQNNVPLKVSIFVGGPPADILSAVMPLPEGMSELTFAGLMNGRRFRYSYSDNFFIPASSDFLILGEVHGTEIKPEGPFGDHLGYYSLTHAFPLLRIRKVFHKNNAIWPFTVVGRPPQEDSVFGKLIHELTGEILPQEIPGLKEVNAVDEAGVHPLLLAIGQERYTPYNAEKRPQELLTIANRILGTGQLSLAKYLLICTDDGSNINTINKPEFLRHLLRRIDLSRDVHFQTNTTIDTLDYSGTGLNSGSKVILAAGNKVLRELGSNLPPFTLPTGFSNPVLIREGMIAVTGPAWTSYDKAKHELNVFVSSLAAAADDSFVGVTKFPLIILCDDSAELCESTLRNFLWITFTRSNPSHDIYGVHEFIENKHWGCRGSLIIDARIKSHHAPVLTEDPQVLKNIQRFFIPGASLHAFA